MEDLTLPECLAQASHTGDQQDQTPTLLLSWNCYPNLKCVPPLYHPSEDHLCPGELIVGSVVWILDRGPQPSPVMRSTWNEKRIQLLKMVVYQLTVDFTLLCCTVLWRVLEKSLRNK